MLDLSKISTDELPIMKLDALRLGLLFLSLAKTSYIMADNIDAEMERRKVPDKDDRKKQMAEAISKALFEPTLSKREDK